MRASIMLYLKGVQIAFANRMAYRGDFVISLLIMLVAELMAPMITYLIYKSGASYPGWKLEEVMLIQGVFMLSRGLGFVLFFGMVGETLNMVREGTFDLMLIKPRPVLFMAIVQSINVQEIGRVLTGVLVCTIAMNQLESPSIIQWLKFIFLLIVSLIVMFAFSVIMASTVIKWVGNGRVFEIFDTVVSFGMYPKSIFSQGFANLITYIVPILLIGFVPAAALLGRTIPGLIYSLMTATIFLILSLGLWRGMLRFYTSAGG